MKKILTLLLLLLISKIYSQNVPQWEWARNVSITDTTQIATDICVDSFENIYISGYNHGSVTIDSQTLAPGHFIAKYNSNGKLLWAKEIEFSPTQMRCDLQNNLYVIATFTGNISVAQIQLTSNGQSDFFIAKFTSLGSLSWVKRYGGKSDDEVTSFCTDSEGNIFLTGSYVNETDIDGNVFNTPQSWRALVFKTNSEGLVQWIRIGDEHMLQGLKIDHDSKNNLYVIGEEFFPGCYMYCRPKNICKYDENGTLLIHKSLFISNQHEIKAFEVDKKDELVLIRTNGRYSAYKLEKFDNLTNLKWSVQLGIGMCSTYSRFDVDNNNNIYALGAFGKSDPQCYWINYSNDTIYRTGIVDLIVSKFSPEGQHILSIHQGHAGYIGSNLGAANAIGDIVTFADHIFVTSYYYRTNSQDTLNFGSNNITNDGNWPQSFVARLSLNKNSLFIKNEIANIPESITLYPNPSPGKFTITGINGNSKVCIYDISGRCIYTRANLPDAEIDLSGKEKGIYFLEAVSDKGIFRKKFIIE